MQPQKNEGESCQWTINVEPLSKAFGSYLKKTIYNKNNVCAICVPIKISEGGPRHQASLGEVSQLRYYVFLNSLNFVLISLFIESFYF